MNILRVISSVDPRQGGPVEGIRQVTPALAARGHETAVVCLDDPSAPWVAEFPGCVHAVGPASGGYGYAPALVPWLRRHAPEYDAVVVHGLWQYPGLGTRRALRGRQPYFVFPHGMLDPWFKRAHPLKHLKKSAYWLVGERRVLRDAAAALFTCEEERLLARRSFRPYRCREAVVSYGTGGPAGDAGAQRAAFLAAFPELRGKRLLLFLSRIHPKKGCDLLIEAFAGVAGRDPGLHLVLAGPDQVGWQAELAALARRLGVGGRVTWTGMLSGDLKWGALRAAEAFALPSHQENFGIVVAEALACGVPVLITDKVNIWREIEADGAGLVAEDTAPGVAALLERWLRLSGGERETLRERAAACFSRRFEIGRAADSLLEALEAGRTEDATRR